MGKFDKRERNLDKACLLFRSDNRSIHRREPVISDIQTFKVQRRDELEKKNEDTEEFYKRICRRNSELVKENLELKALIQDLRKRIAEKKFSEQWEETNKNSWLLKEIFQISDNNEKTVDEILHNLDGCLMEYTDSEGDIIEDIHSIREGW